MSDYSDEYIPRDADGPADRVRDPQQQLARDELFQFFDQHREQVFFSRQIEVMREHRHFHWITNRAIRELVAEGVLLMEQRELRTGGRVNLVWHRSFRFYRRAAARVVEVIEAYSDPNIGGALGLHGEMMVLEGFARNQFLMLGRETREFNGKVWEDSDHDLDFIFGRDGVSYGLEVKNTLGYMDYTEFKLKIRMCRSLGIRPCFVLRMCPKIWVQEMAKAGGFVLIVKFQLYPWTHKALAAMVAEQLGLPTGAPRALEQGTMERFLQWHAKNV